MGKSAISACCKHVKKMHGIRTASLNKGVTESVAEVGAWAVQCEAQRASLRIKTSLPLICYKPTERLLEHYHYEDGLLA